MALNQTEHCNNDSLSLERLILDESDSYTKSREPQYNGANEPAALRGSPAAASPSQPIGLESPESMSMSSVSSFHSPTPPCSWVTGPDADWTFVNSPDFAGPSDRVPHPETESTAQPGSVSTVSTEVAPGNAASGPEHAPPARDLMQLSDPRELTIFNILLHELANCPTNVRERLLTSRNLSSSRLHTGSATSTEMSPPELGEPYDAGIAEFSGLWLAGAGAWAADVASPPLPANPSL